MPVMFFRDLRTRILRPLVFVLVSLVAGVFGSVAAACPNWSLTGQQISYTSDQLWVPQTLSVVAGGQNNLNNCSQPGTGYVATAPDFDLTFSQNGVGRDLEFRINANCDSVLLINAANGQWYFNDDGGEGLNSTLRISNAPEGVYDIWVGTYGPSTCQATLTLETFGGGAPGGGNITPPPSPVCPNAGLNGQMISYDGQGLWVPQNFPVVAGGNMDLGACNSTPGYGHIVQQPDFTLNFTGNPQNYDLEFRVNASCDSVLLINDANGQWHFDDDGGDGLNSLLRLSGANPGLYDIWVGTYGNTNCNATLTAETFPGHVTPPPPPPAVCPDPGMNGQMITFDGQGLWVPQNFPVVAGGNVDLRNCGSVPGHGHIIQNPDFTLNFTSNPQNYDLEFRVNASCDSVLLINDANGQWHFDDDGGDGLNSLLRLAGARAGMYDIWVGTYGGSNCNATLTAETFPAQVVQPPSICPDPGMNGQMITFDGQGLWVPQNFPVVAGGNINLSNCGAVPGHGHIIQSPDFTLNFTSNPQNYDLEFRVNASCDSVLLINDANGQWHFDDDGGDGLNSLLRLAGARPGMYDIWVGTYGGSNCNATLTAETFPAAGGGGGGQPNVLPDPGNMTGYRNQTGQTFAFQVTGSNSGGLWGTGIYTDDSIIARAAVHAGLLQVGQTGVVHVQVLPGQQSYQGTNSNGIQSANYGSWSGSYQFVMGGGGHQAAEAQGQWQINANGWTGMLELDQTGNGWGGTVHFDAHGRTEILQNVHYDPASGMVTFTRPIQGATQMYRGTLSGDQISGQFNQGGGAYSYTWTATRGAGGAMPTTPPPGGGGAPTK